MQRFVYALIALTLLTPLSYAKADSYKEESYRYSSHYREWNHGFYNYYGYREQECSFAGTGYGYVETCYHMRPTDIVYVWERRSGNYRYITVYSDSAYNVVVADYWVEDYGTVHQVHRRRYNNDYYYYGPSYERCYRDSYTGYIDCYDPYVSSVTLNINFKTAEGKIATGLVVGMIGVDILANSHGDDASMFLASMSLASASIMSAAGADQLEKESGLAKSIAEAKASDDQKNSDVTN